MTSGSDESDERNRGAIVWMDHVFEQGASIASAIDQVGVMLPKEGEAYFEPSTQDNRISRDGCVVGQHNTVRVDAGDVSQSQLSSIVQHGLDERRVLGAKAVLPWQSTLTVELCSHTQHALIIPSHQEQRAFNPSLQSQHP